MHTKVSIGINLCRIMLILFLKQKLSKYAILQGYYFQSYEQ